MLLGDACVLLSRGVPCGSVVICPSPRTRTSCFDQCRGRTYQYVFGFVNDPSSDSRPSLGRKLWPPYDSGGLLVVWKHSLYGNAQIMGTTDWVGKVLKTRIDTGMSLLSSRSAFIMVPALRFIGLGIIFILLNAGNRENILIVDMSNCNEICKARGKDLINTCVWASLTQFLFSTFSFKSITSCEDPE